MTEQCQLYKYKFLLVELDYPELPWDEHVEESTPIELTYIYKFYEID